MLWTDKKVWSKPEQHGDIPCARTQFSFTAVGDNIYLFGGDLVHSNRYFGDLYEYNTQTHTWRYLFPKGTGPSPRVGHSASAVGKWSNNNITGTGADKELILGRKIFFFGGHFEADRFAPNATSLLTNGNFNDVHILDLDRDEWLKPSASGNVPTPRSWHSAVVSTSSEPCRVTRTNKLSRRSTTKFTFLVALHSTTETRRTMTYIIWTQTHSSGPIVTWKDGPRHRHFITCQCLYIIRFSRSVVLCTEAAHKVMYYLGANVFCY